MTKFCKLLIAPALIFMAACSSDDDVVTNLADQVKGEYDGYTLSSSNYFANMVNTDQNVKITATSTLNQVDITYTSETLGTTTISGATVSGSNGVYTLSGNGKAEIGHGGSTSTYDCTVAGTITNGVAELTFSYPTVMGGFTIKFLQGEIPADVVLPGTYTGYVNAVAQYFPDGMKNGDQSLTIALGDNGECSLKYSSDTWGTFDIDNIKVENDDNGDFLLSGSGKCAMGMNGSSKDYDCTFTATIDPEKENTEFVFNVPAVMGGLTITFYTGSMPTE